jgi:hypothetical protein
VGVRVQCGGCGAYYFAPRLCHGRTCKDCSRERAQELSGQMIDRVRAFTWRMERQPQWDGSGYPRAKGWKLITLTVPAFRDFSANFDAVLVRERCEVDGEHVDRERVRGVLRDRAEAVRRAFRGAWRRLPWGRQVHDSGTRSKRSRRDTACFLGVEVSPNGVVHVHAAVFGEFVEQRELERVWSDELAKCLPGVGRVRVDIRQIRGDGAAGVREVVLKYALKGVAGFPDPDRAAAVEVAFRGVRRVEVLGELRRVKAALVAAEVPCDYCGGTSWRIPEPGHFHSAAEVAAAGGFGVMHPECGCWEPWANGHRWSCALAPPARELLSVVVEAPWGAGDAWEPERAA